MTSLINASNLHTGGSLQVAVSAISEIAARDDIEDPLTIFLSSTVQHNLDPQLLPAAGHLRCRTVDVRGLDPWNHAARRSMDSFASVFTILGPLYRWSPPFRSIVGFAQAWIIYPKNECYDRLSLLQRLRTRLKFWIQAQFFKRADVLVVELDHVKEGLVRELGIAPERIHVVRNCLSSLYLDQARWQPVDMPPTDCDLRLGFLGRNYPHKNTAVFPEIARALETAHGIRARFYVTFTEQEWQACSPAFRDVSINVGPLTVSQCPSFYQALDGVVFPSLLECFSVTPLEAMAMERPLFASNRPFNVDVCGEHAHYFDPLAPETAADQIAAVLGAGCKPDPRALRAAQQHAIAFSSPAVRAEKYLALLTDDA
jgi:glycosyltransferase involved in cell wall biosynthesis